MEYFRIVKVNTTEAQIQQSLKLSKLDEMSSEIFNLDIPGEEVSNIGGIWGEFTLSRNEIKGGIRFELLECPNALCWTITTGYPPETNSIVVHLTLNRKEISPEFNEEIEEFLSDHCDCLLSFFS